MAVRTIRACWTLLMILLLMASVAGAAITPPVVLPGLQTIKAPVKITNLALSNLLAMGEVEGQVFGASKGQLVALDAEGKTTRTIAIPVDQPAGISAYTPGKAIVGDGSNNSVFAIDIRTGAASRVLDLKTTAFGNLRVGDILRTGKLASVAFDGKYIFVAISAGYSSSIFTIDPATNRAVSQAWSPGDKPTAMQFTAAGLYVLDSESSQIRVLDSNLKIGVKAIDVPAPDAKGIIIRENEVRVLSPVEKSIIIVNTDLSQIKIAPITSAWRIKDIVVGPILPLARDVALLICGDVAESGFDEFWNDTVWMYKALLGVGYTEGNIYVLYGDGSDYASANPAYQHSGTVTDFPATISWVNKVINGLKNGDSSIGVNKLGANDTLFVWVFDHGGGSNPAYFCLRDGDYYDNTFAANLNPLSYKQRAVFMQQCRSGGFLDNMQNDRSYVSTACLATENAHRADTEKETYGGKTYHHGEYNYYIISAISGSTPTGASANADTNGDGKVSVKELHSFMASRENQSESPQQWDSYGVGGAFGIK